MSDLLRILLVEDNPGDSDLILELLPRDEFDVKNVARLTEALECVGSERFDIILLDLGLPDSDGLATLRTMRRQTAELPIVVLTGLHDERTGLAAIREGSQDYLVKGQTDEKLFLRSIKHAVERKKMESALKELNDTLEKQIDERTAQLTSANEKLLIEIDDRKRAEEAMRRIKEEWERTFASVPDLIAIIDNQHQVLRVNDAMARRLGVKPEECTGLPCYEVVHGSSAPPAFCPHLRTMADGREHLEELHVDRFDGDFLVTTTPLHDENGENIGSVHIAHDITERKLFEKGLQQAKELAEAATQAKSLFLANMSHELRTPMTGVLGMLDLALAGNLEAKQREFIETAQRSARSLVRILNDILDLTKIEMGKFSIIAKPFSIRKLVENSFNILMPVAKSKELDFGCKVADDLAETFVGDQTRLNQVLTNLAGNAVKFTEKGRVEIRVEAGGSVPGGRREVTFTVTDTGIGIPDDKKDLLFRAFSQVDESHSRSYGGTGLGLAISKEIVERMEGTITFTSEEGKGSIFSFTVPLCEAESERDAGLAPGKTATTEAAPCAEEIRKPRLLIGEDDQTIRQILGVMLQRSNYEIDIAEDGQKVVEMWEEGEYDLILMDVQMPRMNGFEATAAIRANELTRGGHIPIVAMTAHALKEDEDRCLAAGMDAYISKPIDFRVCLQVIGETLKKNGRRSCGIGPA